MNNGKICISVCAETAEEMITKIKRAETLADVIEVRFDWLDPTELERCRTEISNLKFEIPLLATFRPSDQGGKNSSSYDERVAFWQKPSEKFWAADVEEDILDATTIWPNRLISFHDFSKVPADLSDIYTRLSSQKPEIVKIVAYADDIADSLAVWKLLEQDNRQTISIAMGDAGKWTRILGFAHGAYMTYASLDEGEETAYGQITAKDLIEVYRVKELDKNTAVYGVIGDPVSSSKSPYMHNAAFAAEAINAVFLPLLVKNLDEFIRRMVAASTREVELNFAGFSVTMPHKQAIMKHLDEIDSIAERIGAVNTVKITDGKLIGYNTDAHGFITPLETKFGDLKSARVAILGAGGAARACVYALTHEGASVMVFARDMQKANSFAEEFNVHVQQFPLADSEKFLVENFDIVVNTTPLGMKGAFENESPLTAEQLRGVKFVYDLVTRSGDTPLIAEAKEAGAETIDGVEMLISQGLRQFEIWAGREAPEAAMRQAVSNRLSK